MIYVIIIIILLMIIYTNNIEPLTNYNIDDVKFIPISDESNEYKHLPTMYYKKFKQDHQDSEDLFTKINDYMGKDSHHYIFEAPMLKKKEKENIDNNIIQKTYTSMLDRPIYLPDTTNKPAHYNKLSEKDKNYINEPFKYPYRHPQQLGNKIVYDHSKSTDLETELKERQLRLRGFHRSILDDKNDYTEMTFCNNIDEEGTDFPCKKYGLKFNYDLDNQMKLAKNNKYSSKICCV